MQVVRERKLLYYETPDGETPFTNWLDELDKIDPQASISISARLTRLQKGNFGDYKAVGKGVMELRVHYGSGYRVYFGVVGLELILLLVGGTKRTQKEDIRQAQAFLEEYKQNVTS